MPSDVMDILADEDSEKLINLVSQHSPLYDSKHEGYKNQQVKDNIWKEIARELNKNSDTCKKHWKNLRDGYVRFKRKNKLSTGSAAPKNSRTKWKTYRLLSFLDTVAQERPGISNIEISSIDDESTQDSTGETPVSEGNNTQGTSATINSPQPQDDNESLPPREEAMEEKKQKRRRLTKHQDGILDYLRERDESRKSVLKMMSQNCKENELGSFAAYIRDALNKMPPVLQIMARQEVFQVITKYEMMAFETPSSRTYNPSSDSAPTPSVSRPLSSVSSNYRELDIYSSISNSSESTDVIHRANTESQEQAELSIMQINDLVNNYPNCSGH